MKRKQIRIAQEETNSNRLPRDRRKVGAVFPCDMTLDRVAKHLVAIFEPITVEDLRDEIEHALADGFERVVEPVIRR